MYQLIIHDYNSDESLINVNISPKEHSENFNSRNTSGTEILNNSGMGLENIRGRVESVNGKLNISTNNGFRVFVTIPK